jgi:hypothetical protein
MASQILAPLSFIALLSACSAHSAPSPAHIAGIEKEFGVEICEGSKAAIVDDLGIVKPSPVYEINFPNRACVDKFLDSVIADATYEHPFGDNSKLLGSSTKRHFLFSTIRNENVVIFHVNSTAWMDKKFKKS